MKCGLTWSCLFMVGLVLFLTGNNTNVFCLILRWSIWKPTTLRKVSSVYRMIRKMLLCCWCWTMGFTMNFFLWVSSVKPNPGLYYWKKWKPGSIMRLSLRPMEGYGVIWSEIPFNLLRLNRISSGLPVAQNCLSMLLERNWSSIMQQKRSNGHVQRPAQMFTNLLRLLSLWKKGKKALMNGWSSSIHLLPIRSILPVSWIRNFKN